MDVGSLGSCRILYALYQTLREASVETCARCACDGWSLCSLGNSWPVTESLHILGMERSVDSHSDNEHDHRCVDHYPLHQWTSHLQHYGLV